MPGHRLDRVANLIREEISATIMADLSDPSIGMLTVVRVSPSPDLRTAKVWVSVMGEIEEQKNTMRGLNRARGRIQARVASALRLKYTPVLRFYLDESVKKSLRIMELLDEVSSETHSES